ncbi:L-threonylcarbamoyladenylate synthase [Clostridium sediminicola]|uniref:L-threonylcarbamoyladenylate synthase n=1 Tax=Clostridium sediminicola TaxID=3114879 RepID=UPI0031F200D0
METKIVKIDESKIDNEVIIEAGSVFRKGGLVVFPTETVYGLGANALDEDAVKKIFIAKGRPQDNPLIIHVASTNVESLVDDIPIIAKKMMKELWPGPLTIILKKSQKVPYTTSAGLETVGIRMPSNTIARKLIEEANVPIAAPSANLSGKPSPTTLESCVEDLNGRVNFIIGGDISEVGLESTIVDCTVDPPCILRPGAITLERLQKIDSRVYIDPALINKPKENIKPKAPGMKYRHYAPKAPLKIVKGELEETVSYINECTSLNVQRGMRVGIIACEETKYEYTSGIIKSLGKRANLNEISQNLFSVLRSFNNENVDLIFAESYEEEGIGIAIMNRLKKAAGYDIIEL